MEFFFNGLSMEGQFRDMETFRDAIGHLMQLREVIRGFDCSLHCHGNMGNALVMEDLVFSKAVQKLLPDKRRAVMQWVTGKGPFWDDERRHDPDEYLECDHDGRMEVVTDSAIGEAAHRSFEGDDSRLVSLSPSSWEFTPVSVTWIPDNGKQKVDVPNYWAKTTLETELQQAAPPISSWEELERHTRARFTHLTFSEASFHPLRGHPFVDSAARQIRARFQILDILKNSFDEAGQRTPAGQETYQKHFTGDHAWFSDSSDGEKQQFREALTFRHPTTGDPLFCPWHGKVRTQQLRIHFSWPVRAHEPLYVVYVGPKITKR